MTHICVSKLTIIGSDNGLSPSRRQAIILTNGGILLIRNLGTNFSEILSEIYAFFFAKIHMKMSSGKWRPFCLGLNVLMHELHNFESKPPSCMLRVWSGVIISIDVPKLFIYSQMETNTYHILSLKSLYFGLVTPYGVIDFGQQWFG